MKILIIGEKKYIGRHFSTIEKHFGSSLKFFEQYYPEAIINEKPDLVIVPDEHWCELANIVSSCKKNNILTLQLMDGILEWRRTWEYTEKGHNIDGVINPLNQPVIAHKVACIGARDYMIIESWGNIGKCEIVGIPRLKHIIGLRSDFSHLSKKKNKILVCTAKTPAFTAYQMDITRKSLRDIKQYFENRSDIEIIWRLTGTLSEELEIKNTLNDLNGLEIHKIIMDVDAVITTPSTTLLEAMILKTPVAMLDYHNTPHYFQTAWCISSKDHIDSTIRELLAPPINKLEFQDFLLNDQLFIREDPTQRFITLIERMLEFKNEPEHIPPSLLENYASSTLILKNDLGSYYPEISWVDKLSRKELQMEIASARGTITVLEEKIFNLQSKLKLCLFYQLGKLLKNFIKKL